MVAHRRHTWQARIGGVASEYAAARAAADLLVRGLARGEVVRPADPNEWDVAGMSANLEATYLIRLFAAFEAGVRSYWATVGKTVPLTRDLIDAVAARRGIPDGPRAEVHEVREYRNGLIHERDNPSQPTPLPEARGRLRRFFSYLPERW
jgi:hypothetical protein